MALSTIRVVLDPDRRSHPEDFIVADNDAVALNLDNVDVDLERFLGMATEGLAYTGRGEAGLGLSLLESAAAAYSGDFLEENPYDEWAVPAREEARAAYVAVARTLARQAISRSDADRAVRHLLRILEIDGYDEDANLELVGARSQSGRHGEAQRHYLAYRQRMDDLGVEPMPFPGPVADGARPPWRASQSSHRKAARAERHS